VEASGRRERKKKNYGELLESRPRHAPWLAWKATKDKVPTMENAYT
jgi:hypothetical protein